MASRRRTIPGLGQCEATTNAGRPCRIVPAPGQERCHVHGGKTEADIVGPEVWAEIRYLPREFRRRRVVSEMNRRADETMRKRYPDWGKDLESAEPTLIDSMFGDLAALVLEIEP